MERAGVCHMDPGILEFVQATFGDPVNGDQLDLDGLAIKQVLAIAGMVNLIEIATMEPSIPLGDCLLDSLNFTTLAPGNSTLI